MSEILSDPVEEARRILVAARSAGVVMRAVGGVAINLRAPSVRQLLPPRDYHDVDMAARAGSSASVTQMMRELGYEDSRRFNLMNGRERLLYWDPVNGRRVDVFLDAMRMCHVLPFRARLEIDRETLPLAELALTKLQIVQLTDRDAQDLCALFADHPFSARDEDGINLPRILEVCSGDWGWWRTVIGSLDRLISEWRDEADAGRPEQAALVRRAVERAEALRARLCDAPKTTRWRMRALVGEKRCWYALPEEVR